MPKFELRHTSSDDIPALNALYERLTGRRRSLSQYHWEWHGGPDGPGMSWVIVERASGQIAAHHGLVPVPLCVGGKPVAAARTENTMIDPAFAGRFPYHAYEALCLKQAKERFSVLFTTAGKGAPGAVRQRLGYQVVGHWSTYTVAATAAYLGQRLVGTAGSVLGRSGAPDPVDLIETRDPDRVGALWRQASPAFGITAARSASHIAWRLSDHAYHTYRMFVLTGPRRDRGFIAFHEMPGPRGTSEIMIEDVFSIDNRPDSLMEILRSAAVQLRGRPARMTMRIVGDDTPLARALAGVQPGYARLRGPAPGGPFLAWSADPLKDYQWEMTRFVAQGILDHPTLLPDARR